MARDDHVARELIKGVIAGAVATWAMGKVTTYLYERENTEARHREDSARHGKTAYGVAAEKMAHAVGVSLDGKEGAAASAVHWGLGLATAAAFAVLRARYAQAGRAAGLAFGSAFWLLMDEGAVYALGLTPGPTAFPWQTHARGLAGHLVYGAVSNAALDVLDRVA